ncbi:creatininase family protein [Schauerella aestuarii]|uniref:creatininase family protein n=1 Tax=Schauerella aestuarii TaxID=2511204 RepID=UPI001370B597|nr:creatininase family protein [Achromobacter aestuarii]MYZ45889.1 creatininase family protein [Achromobacter aestuarii]
MSRKTYLPLLTNEEAAAASRAGEVLLLPLGTVESNGPHQILGCDFIVAERLAEVVAARTNALRMPTFHYGISELHGGLPGTFALSEPLFTQMIEALLRGAAHNGFKHVVLFNCHRHNHQPIEILARALRREQCIGVAVIDPLEVARDLAREQFAGDPAGAVGHGGEPLMSLIAHLNPDDIRMDRAASPDLATFHGLQALSSTRFKFGGSKVGLFPYAEEVNASGAWADLSTMSAERGQIAFERLCDFTVDFVEAFRAMPLIAEHSPRGANPGAGA